MRTRDMEPNQPGQRPCREYDLRPIPPSLIVPLETRRCSVRNYKTEHGTKAADHKVSRSHQDKKSMLTNTVSSVLDIPKFFVVWLMTEMVVDQAAKNMSMCQHRKSAVARMAFQKVEPNDLSCRTWSGKEGSLVADAMEN